MNVIEHQPIDPALLAGLGEIQPFKLTCWYMKGFDWLIFQTKDCSTTEEQTTDPRIERLIDNATGQVVGLKILDFGQLPQVTQNQVFEATGFDLDDIKGIEHVWMKNVLEQHVEISASEVDFLAELRQRIAAGIE